MSEGEGIRGESIYGEDSFAGGYYDQIAEDRMQFSVLHYYRQQEQRRQKEELLVRLLAALRMAAAMKTL